LSKAPSSPFLQTLDAILEGRTGGWFINIIVIPLLFLLALILPPLSLPQRVMGAGFTGVQSKTGGGVSLDDGTQFSIPAGAAKSGVSIKLSEQTREAFAKSEQAKSIPSVLDIKSPLYQPGIQGQAPALAILSIPIPEAVDPWATLDVYGVSGKKWSKLPFQLYPDEQRIEVYLMGSVPEGVLLAQTQPQSPAISADISGKNLLPASAIQLLAEVNPLGLTIADGGGIAGSVSAEANTPYQILPTVSNILGGQLRSDLTDDMITNGETRKQHVQALVDLAVEKLYPGLNIDYQGITPENKNDFSAFVRDLAQALHAKDKLLSVTVSMPTPKSSDNWDTGPFDWAAIGQAADIVKIPLPMNSDAYQGNSPLAQSYLQWAVGRVDRYKVQLSFSVGGRDEFGTSYAPISFSNALKLLGPVNLSDKPQPGAQVQFDLPRAREGGLKYDAPTGLYSFTYKDDKGQTHTVSLESADSLAKKLALALQFNVRGVALRDVNAEGVDVRAWVALKQYRQTQKAGYKSNLMVVWRVNGQAVGKSPATDPKFAWTAPTQAGAIQVEAAFSFDDGQTVMGSTGAQSVLVANVLPTPRPTATPRPGQPAGTTDTGTQPAAKPTSAPPPPGVSNFRGVNMFNYGAQLNWTNSDNNNEMGQLNQLGFKWAKIQVRWCDFEGAKGNADLSQLDRLMNAATAKGIKVMFSVVCAPTWSRADRGAGGSGPPDNMQDAADFMSGLAGKYCGTLGAIEVWNEHNLLTEWHGKPISAALYMDMLKKAYPAIKNKCNSVVVISGAPTPTGVNSAEAVDDAVFLEQMYQNGLKDYSDAVGAHPSGFCNAPDAAEGASNPCGGQYNNHRSFFFKRTLESYRAVMVKYKDEGKQIWPTEFGWGADPTPKPGYDYERNITPDMQAQWLVRAYQMMKASGYVGVAILWNLDFTNMGSETGAFHVVDRPAFGALAGMAK
jgi:hypothetical protein